MLKINMNDVINVLNTLKPYLIGLAVVFVLMIIAFIAAGRCKRPLRKFIRGQGIVAFLLVAVVIINMICFGPMSSLISLATGNSKISKESSDEATKLAERIADEGIVLLKNEAQTLPITSSKKLNVFGWASTNPVYGGTGSGSLSDAYETVSLLEGLKNAGFETNEELSEFYRSYRADRPEVGMWAQDWTLPEPPADTYTDDMMKKAQEFSDTALVIISRVGGEGADLPVDVSKVTYTDNSDKYKDFEPGEHFLSLSRSERDMLDLVCSHFDNVTVVYNGANTMELGFVNEYPQIKGALWCPGTGQSGFNSLGRILSGEINPSGKTSDTFVYDLTKTPVYNNFGSFVYDNMKEFATFDPFTKVSPTPSFVNYVEGIYVGYRFYETAAAEGIIDYEKTVQYPFGYGLSYTQFAQKMGELKTDGNTISVDVTVTNKGQAAGKDVVELYANPPYTNGGIEKASANLLTFAKTDVIEPGQSQTLTLSFSKDELASYDYKTEKAWVLENGSYELSIRSDSHTPIEAKTYEQAEKVVYGGENPHWGDQTTATNQFDDAAGSVTYLSRADHFANYAQATAAPSTLTLAEDVKATFMNNSNYNPEAFNKDTDEMPVTGAKNGMKLADLRGADYDDERWDTLLDQLTIADMDTMIALAGYQTPAADSVEKLQTIDCDGPASINNNFTKTGSIGFPSAVMIASTWNVDLAREFGENIGRMADEMGVSGWYAPAMNNHRSAFAGRNFEYYSEDGVLAGEISAAAVLGAQEHGVYAYMKHFALNDQEQNRTNMLCTWSNEQAIREIYLKPFEITVKKGKVGAVMSAFNYIGTEPAGADPQLLNTVLRDEWGFKGFVLTDYFGVYGYQDADRMIRNGNDACLVAYDTETNHVSDTKSATSVKAMRQATKNIMYTVVNSRAYMPENIQTGPQNWQIAAWVIDGVLLVGLVLLEYRMIKLFGRRRAKEAETRTDES